MPNGLLLLGIAFRPTPWVYKHYNCVTQAVTLLDMSFYLYFDMLILAASGRAIEWPAAFGMIHAIGVSIGHHTGPCSIWWTWVQMTWRLICTAGILAYAGQWGAIVTNYGIMAQLVGCVVNIALAPMRDAKMRRMYAKHVEGAAAAASRRKKLD